MSKICFMNIKKVIKDRVIKVLNGPEMVPIELIELNKYFHVYGGINFDFKKSDEGYTIARSTNFKYGSIITSGRNEEEVDKNIKDAILTSFEIPSVYLKESKLRREGVEKQNQSVYALA